mmetsp:Transcript_5758/g.9540  ORF Transcript_5758/g.9540 Transcript_5758/m.9540 type:complete len:131 (-) Transcript_5758:1523-1915(-)
MLSTALGSNCLRRSLSSSASADSINLDCDCCVLRKHGNLTKCFCFTDENQIMHRFTPDAHQWACSCGFQIAHKEGRVALACGTRSLNGSNQKANKLNSKNCPGNTRLGNFQEQLMIRIARRDIVDRFAPP